ncbi:hypothetical protein Tco_0359411 [Tanacetum coccineum]
MIADIEDSNLGSSDCVAMDIPSLATQKIFSKDSNLLQEMEERDMTMEEYVQYESEKALRKGKVYNWETTMYGKISWRLDDDNINDLRIFETRFPAIVYDDALTFESCFLSETTVSPQHVDELIWKNETSLSEYDDEKYNVISYNDLFLFNIIFADELKLDTDNDDDEIDTKIPSYSIR